MGNLLLGVAPTVDSDCYKPRKGKQFLTDGLAFTAGDYGYWHSCKGNAWAKFALPRPTKVFEVLVTNRCDGSNHRLTGAKVFIGTASGEELRCGDPIPYTAKCATATVECGGLEGTSVILRGTATETLNVVEVAAFEGWCGPMCIALRQCWHLWHAYAFTGADDRSTATHSHPCWQPPTARA